MTANELKSVMNGYYGGSEGRTRHWANRKLVYTDGVKAVADAVGAYWLLDIIATEVAPLSLNMWEFDSEHTTFFKMVVGADSTAKLWLERDIGEPKLWERDLDFTTFPEGEWMFYLMMDAFLDDKPVLVMLIPQEN